MFLLLGLGSRALFRRVAEQVVQCGEVSSSGVRTTGTVLLLGMLLNSESVLKVCFFWCWDREHCFRCVAEQVKC